MPRKMYDDEALRKRAIELRRNGYSYRQIAKELGCSVYKIHELISSYENPSERIKMVIDLADKVEKISSEVSLLSEKLEKLKADAEIKRSLEELKSRLEKLEKKLSSIEEDVSFIHSSSKRRLRDEYRCEHLDDEGFCTLWYWKEKVEGWVMKAKTEKVKGKTVYLLSAKEHPLICSACPNYET